LGDSLCKANSVCSSLSSEACSKFGVQVKYGREEEKAICHSGYVAQAEMAPGDLLTASMWYLGGANVSLNCYLGCTEDGRVPAKHPDTRIESDQLDRMVSTNDTFRVSSPSRFS